MTIDLTEARTLVRSDIWPHVRDNFLATGAFTVYPKGDLRRLEYVDEATRQSIDVWLRAIPLAEQWRKIVDGEQVRSIKSAFPGVYPDILRYAAYFRGCADCRMKLLKLKFPEVYKLCFC